MADLRKEANDLLVVYSITTSQYNDKNNINFNFVSESQSLIENVNE